MPGPGLPLPEDDDEELDEELLELEELDEELLDDELVSCSPPQLTVSSTAMDIGMRFRNICCLLA